MRAPNANPDAKILAKKPTKLGGQRRRRGGRVPALCTACNKKPPETGGSAEGAGGLPSHPAKLSPSKKEAADTFCCEVSDD